MRICIVLLLHSSILVADPHAGGRSQALRLEV